MKKPESVIFEELRKKHKYQEMFNCNIGFWILNMGGNLTYGDGKDSYDMSHLTEEEVNELIEKSVEDKVNYIFEKVKDHKIILDLKPDCLY